jgi:tRNA threonylcarbamoyladenosine biosynthesis protein TsaE
MTNVTSLPGKSFTLEQVSQVAKEIIKFAGNEKIWLFYGEMGAGKTTLIKEVCRTLGVAENISSPTFSLVNEYQTDTKDIIYHFDFYRIKTEREALEIGLEEYFYSGSLCLVEWPSKIDTLLPDHYVKISLTEEQVSQEVKEALSSNQTENLYSFSAQREIELFKQ